MTQPITVALGMDLSWRYASGAAMERFCEGLRERRIEALMCSGCGRRYLPPRPVCGDCCRPMDRWVPVDDVGRLEAWTIVHVPIVDGRTGRRRPVPYGMGLIRLDGADTTINHYLRLDDVHRPERDGGQGPSIGLRVRAVWRDELRGAMDDIACFEGQR